MVLLSGFLPHKLSVSITINPLVYFGLITADTDSLEIFVWSHYPFWMIHNLHLRIFPSTISNEDDFQWYLLIPPQVHYCRKCWRICEPEQIYKNCGEFPKKPIDSSGCAATIKLSENNSYSNHMTEYMVRDCLKDIFQPPISWLCE